MAIQNETRFEPKTVTPASQEQTPDKRQRVYRFHPADTPAGRSKVARQAISPRAAASSTLPKTETDHELVTRVQAGDKQAFNLLVEKYQHKLFKLISRYIHDRTEALDVTQEAFIKAYRALPKFRGDSSFYTWLYRIGLNAAKNHLAALGRRLPDSDIDAQDAERYCVDSRLKDHESPEALTQCEEIERTVFLAMDELHEDLRAAITLRELDGLTYEEVAQVMDCPIGTVRSRIYRAREAIDKRLRPLL